MAIANRGVTIVLRLAFGMLGIELGLYELALAQVTISEPRPAHDQHFGQFGDKPISRDQDEANGSSRPSPYSFGSAVDRPSVLSDFDCSSMGPAEVSADTGNFHRTFPRPPVDSVPDANLPGLRRGADTGRLHQAYTQSYRSQLPALKELHPNDAPPAFDSRNGESDLFGSYSQDKKTLQRFGNRGQWFGRYEALVAWPYYSNGHQGLTLQAGALSIAEPFDYNLFIGNRAVVGWESKKGPGGMFQFTDLFAIAEQLTVGAVGGISGLEGQVNVPGRAPPFSISALSGERLDSTAREHLTSYRPTAFKRVYFPVSTITGGFGFEHTVLRQSVRYSRFANLATTAPNETMEGHRRFSGIGPSFDIEYHRPIGHTPLAMIGGAQMGVVFGSDRWSVLENGALAYQQSSRRVITNANVRIGVEWSQAVGSRPDSRVFARFTVEGQNWLNAGNFSSSEASLGFLSGNFAIGAAY
jgi:hypothetical protein